MGETKGTWGGRREGAGRRPQAKDGTERKMRSLRASDSEWELIKEFAKFTKDNEEKARAVLNAFKTE